MAVTTSEQALTDVQRVLDCAPVEIERAEEEPEGEREMIFGSRVNSKQRHSA
jgi:hypothetical protein